MPLNDVLEDFRVAKREEVSVAAIVDTGKCLEAKGCKERELVWREGQSFEDAFQYVKAVLSRLAVCTLLRAF